jgi:hypothetical protein
MIGLAPDECKWVSEASIDASLRICGGSETIGFMGFENHVPFYLST